MEEYLSIAQIGERMEKDRISRIKEQIKEEEKVFNEGMREMGNGSIKMISN